MDHVDETSPPYRDLRTFARYIRERKPSLFRVLIGPTGHQRIWDGLMALVKETNYPHKIEPTDKVSETLESLIPYVEAYSETTDSGESAEGEQTLQLL